MKSAERLRFQQIRETTTFRMAIVFGSLFAFGLIAFGGLIYAMTSRDLTARSDQILRQEAQQLLGVPTSTLPLEIRAAVVRNRRGLNYFALLSSSGKRIGGNFGPIPILGSGKTADIEAQSGHGPMRVMAVSTPAGETILLGRDIGEIRHLLSRMTEIMLASSFLVILSVLSLGGVLSIDPLRRVRDLEAASRQIASGRFDVRIRRTARNDEFDKIAAMINVMVDDIERVISQVKTVTDTIAHDLRTPLTRVRNRLDEVRAGLHLRKDIEIDDLIGDLDIVLDRFGALLRISELEASERRAGFGRIDVSVLLNTVSELYAPVAEDAGILLIAGPTEALEIEGDAGLLLEAIGNLVDNAIKFARNQVQINASGGKGVCVIEVRDDGPGIAQEEREAALQRFYRTSAGVGVAKPGFGLGLSIVTAILHIHRYALRLDDAHPGLSASVTATATDAAAPDHA